MADRQLGANVAMTETPSVLTKADLEHLRGLAADPGREAAYIARGEKFRRRLREAMAGREWSESEPAASESTRVES